MAQTHQENFERSLRSVSEELNTGMSPADLEDHVDELLKSYDTLKRNAVEVAIIQAARSKIEALLPHGGWVGHDVAKALLEDQAKADAPMNKTEQDSIDNIFRGILANTSAYKSNPDEISKDRALRAAAITAQGFRRDTDKWKKFEDSITLVKANSYVEDIRKELDSKTEISYDTTKIAIKNPRTKSEAEGMVRQINEVLATLADLSKTAESEKGSLEGLMTRAATASVSGSTVSAFEIEIGRNEKERDEADRNIKKQEQKIERKKEELKEVPEESAKIEQKIERKEKELAAIPNENKDEKKAIQNEIDELKSEKEVIEKKAKKEIQKEIDDLISEKGDMEQKKQNAENQLTSLTAKKTDAEKVVKKATDLESDREKNRTQKETDLKTLKEKIREFEKIKKDLQEVLPFIRTEKMSSQQLLAQALSINQGKEISMDAVQEEMEGVLRNHEKAAEKKMKPFEKILSIASPSLEKTLDKILGTKEINETDDAKRSEMIKKLLKNSKNPEGLKEWMKEMGGDAKKKVPILVAYLTYAVAEKKLSGFDQGKTETLLESLRKARNKLITDQINEDPELGNKDEQTKTEAYLKELRTWEKGTASINKENINDLVTESRIKKGSLAAGGVGLAVLAGWGAISGIAGFIGLKGFGIAGGYGAGRFGGPQLLKKLGYNVDEEKYKKYYSPAAQAIISTALFGPLGLAVPAAVMGTKWRYKNKKNLGKDKETGEKAIKGVWAVTGKIVGGIGSIFSRNKKAA